jgi:outer membrane protein OmpA-like peptidoglycan-associated protein
VSDSKHNPPPDDFSKTTPNVNLPEGGGQGDWDKTNYNFPRQPSSDEWGKTVTNIKPIDTDRQDFGKTMHPGQTKVSDVDWGVTRANVDVRQDDFGAPPEAYEGGYDKTTPYFRLPEAERAKYQQLPPTPAEQAAQDAKEKKGGIPGWVWVSAGLLCMFFFAVIVLLIVWYISSRETNFNVIVKSAPLGSDVRVDGKPWGVTRPDGSIELLNLSPGTKTITIEHPSYECLPKTVEGGYGVTPEPVIAQCQERKVAPGENCTNIGLGEEDKAERCYNAALDALPDPFTPDDLVKALNILIINFANNSFEIPPRRLAALKKGAGFIQKLPPSVVLEIGGHTDNRGSADKNQTLSDSRASAVKQALVGFGVRGEALQTKGYGSTRPKPGVDGNTEQGRFYNRRIEYSVLTK